MNKTNKNYRLNFISLLRDQNIFTGVEDGKAYAVVGCLFGHSFVFSLTTYKLYL